MYLIIILPLVAAALAEVLKFLIPQNKRSFSLKNLFSYSGMPSGHAAIVSSLTTIVGLREGIDSTFFGLSFVFAVIVLRDAIGLRKYLGMHGKVLNILVKDLKEDDVLTEHYPRLLENIGHTNLQVFAGLFVGILTSIVGYIIFK
jgi:hypothetical protein